MRFINRRVAALATVCALVISAGVACGGVVPQIPDVPAYVEGADQNIYAAAAKGVGTLTAAAALANTISSVEDRAAREGAIPSEVDVVFDRAMLAYVEASDAAMAKILAGVETWDELRTHLQPVIDRVNDLSRLAEQVGVIKSRVGEWIATLRDIVLGGLGDGLGQGMLGGVR